MKKTEYNDLKLPAGTSEEIVRATMIAELSCGVTGTTAELDMAMTLLEGLVADFVKKCESAGIGVHFPKGTFRPMTREEALAFTPRKYHYAPDGDRVCSTEFVSQKQLTDDRSKVTCKLCLKVIGSDERVEDGRSKAPGRKERKGGAASPPGHGEEGQAPMVPGKGRG